MATDATNVERQSVENERDEQEVIAHRQFAWSRLWDTLLDASFLTSELEEEQHGVDEGDETDG